MSKYSKIVILDEDNTALGPFMAALLTQNLYENQIDWIEVIDVGNVVLFPEPINPKIEAISQYYNINLKEHIAHPLDESHLGEGTVVLALDKESKDKAYANFPNATNVYTLKEFLGSSGDIKLPIGGSLGEYDKVIDVARGLIENLVQQLKEEE